MNGVLRTAMGLCAALEDLQLDGIGVHGSHQLHRQSSLTDSHLRFSHNSRHSGKHRKAMRIRPYWNQFMFNPFRHIGTSLCSILSVFLVSQVDFLETR